MKKKKEKKFKFFDAAVGFVGFSLSKLQTHFHFFFSNPGQTSVEEKWG